MVMAALVAGLVVGCSPQPGGNGGPAPQLDAAKIARIASIVRLGTKIAVDQGLLKWTHNDARLAFRAGAEAITAAVDGGNFNPTALQAYIDQELDRAKLSQFKDPVRLTLTIAVEAYAGYWEQNAAARVDNAIGAFKPVLLAIADGIRDSLSAPAPLASYPPGMVNPLSDLKGQDLKVVRR